MTDDAVTVTVDNRRWAYWDNIEIHLSIDRHATVGFDVPFEPERAAFRNTFVPFSFKPLNVDVDGERVLTGTLVDIVPRLESDARTCAITGYSRPGVLEDSDPEADLLPLELNGLGIRQIAQRLTASRGFSVVFEADEGAPFKRVAANPDQKIQAFLVGLARQRGLLISSTPQGEPLFWKAVAPGRPVAKLREGVPPVSSVVPTFSPQEYFSEITGIVSTKRGRVGSRYTERNTRLAGGALRTASFILDDTEKADAPAAVRAKLGRMFGNMVSYVVDDLPTWRDPSGKLWQPNTTLTLRAPSAMIYRDYEFLIRDVFLRQDAGKKSAALGLVLPSAFSGEIPDRLPWEGDDIDAFIDDLLPLG